ncbi:hypothetical protein [Desulfocucumis palustris]|uniref:hypothetical protein n=1 Tax=Desulfocucumis palustris TaxID=1898651 RepID=UPI000CEA368C|nr:hypothetical protein [Desulfocucumis palustris]
MRKISVILLALVLMVIAGCASQSAVPELQALAAKEKEWLDRLQPISEEINNDYSQWESGQISRDELANRLSKQMEPVKEMRDEYDQYYMQNKLTDELKQTPEYDKGLYYGYSLRLNVTSFLQEAVQGYPSAPSAALKNAAPNTDEKLKEFYRTEMQEGYDRKIGLLQDAINKLTQ